MKILKVVKNRQGYMIVVDNKPQITYERVGQDYIGSATDSKGSIIFSDLLGYSRMPGAFGGREIELLMKDGTKGLIKDYWYDRGYHRPHGDFVGVGIGTVESLQDCYVYQGMNINKRVLEEKLDEYFKTDKVYTYDEVREWCRMQHKWYNVIVHGETIPYMINKYGECVEKETKERVVSRWNVIKRVNGKCKEYHFFKIKYNEKGRLRKIEANYFEVLRESLPYTQQEIIDNCKLNKETIKIKEESTRGGLTEMNKNILIKSEEESVYEVYEENNDNIEEIKAYKVGGVIYETKEEAIKAKTEKQLEEYLERISYRGMDSSGLIIEILETKEELYKILRDLQ